MSNRKDSEQTEDAESEVSSSQKTGISVQVNRPTLKVKNTDVDHGDKEIGGRDGPDPTRYGDWEKNGRCIDF